MRLSGMALPIKFREKPVKKDILSDSQRLKHEQSCAKNRKKRKSRK